MGLSNDLISQFAKITNDNKTNQTESTVYGTVSIIDGRPWVKFDGSDRLTPANTTAAVAEGERVTVLVKDHSATITGNVSSPAAKDNDVKELGNKIDEFDTIVADKVKAETAEIETAIITKLDGKYATFESLDANYASIKSLESAEADIDELKADNVEIKGKITARDAEIDQLKADSLTVEVADAKYATIENLEGTNAKFNNLESTYGDFVDLTTDKFEAIEGTIKDLDVESLNARYANIDFSNIGKAAMENFYANSGLIKNVVVGDQTITGELVGVTIRGDRIIGGSIVADKLVIKGDDGIYYKLNAEGGATPDQLATEEFKNGLHGSNIIANSITAEKIKVDDLVAFDATIGNFNIGDNSIYSGAKSSVSNTTRGIYMDTDGQLNFGDSNNYLKFYKDQNGTYKLDISASSLKFGTSGKNVEEAINDVQNSVNNIQVGGRNLLKFTSELPIGTTRENGVYSWAGNNVLANTNDGIKLNFTTVGEDCIGLSLVSDGIVKSGDTLTLSFDYRGTITYFGSFYFVQRTPPNKNYYNFPALTANETEWQHYEHTFTATNANAGTCYSILMFYGASKLATDWVEIKKGSLKLEKGNKATDWTPAPEDMDAAIDNIQVGGRNLLLNSARVLMTGSDQGSQTYTSSIENDYVKIVKTSNGNVYNNTGGIKTAVTRKKGEQYTVSFDILTPTDIGFYWYPSEKYNDSHQGTHISASSNWQKVTFTYTQTGADTTGMFLFGFYYLVAGETYCYKNLKLEIGNKATDWTPAPEDTEASIQVLDNKITSNVSATNSLITRVSTVEQTASGLSSRVTSVENMEIGGRNLILNTSTDFIVNATNNTHTFVYSICYSALEVGETYTFSAEITVEGTSNPQVSIIPYNLNTNTDGGSHIVLADGTRQSVTFTVTKETPYLLLYAGVAGNTGGIKATYHHIKLEKGNKATDWTPAPEDVDAAIDNIQVGGRNYFSTKTQSAQKFDSNGEFRLHDYQNKGSFTQFFNLTVPMSTFLGKECVLSFDIISPNGETPLQVYNSNGDVRYLMNVTGIKSPISTSWISQKLKITVTDRGESKNVSNSNKIEIYCPNQMGCKVRNVKFEIGNKATDWTPAPEDIDADIDNVQSNVDNNAQKIAESESNIEQLSNQISTLVQDGSGKSLMTQTSTGWTFSMGAFEEALNNLLSHIEIGMFNNKPCLELKVDESEQSLMLTNTDIRFMESNSPTARITGDTMNIDNATIDNKFSINGYEWSRDSDDTLNLVFK